MRNLVLSSAFSKKLALTNVQQLASDDLTGSIFLADAHGGVRRWNEVSLTQLIPAHTDGDRSIINITFLPDELILVVVYSSGQVTAIDPGTEEILEETVLAGGKVSAAQWSPDFEFLAVVTNDDRVHLYDRTYEFVKSADLNPEGFGRDEFVTVGWGKKETQFHGSAGKENRGEKKQEGAALPNDAHQPVISWRGDGEYFAVNCYNIANGTRRFRVYSRDGVHCSSSELEDGLLPVISWRPAGDLIASVKENRQVVLFERNGLRHGGFEMDGDWVEVLGIEYNANSDVIAVSGERHCGEYAVLRSHGFHLRPILVSDYDAAEEMLKNGSADIWSSNEALDEGDFEFFDVACPSYRQFPTYLFLTTAVQGDFRRLVFMMFKPEVYITVLLSGLLAYLLCYGFEAVKCPISFRAVLAGWWMLLAIVMGVYSNFLTIVFTTSPVVYQSPFENFEDLKYKVGNGTCDLITFEYVADEFMVPDKDFDTEATLGYANADLFIEPNVVLPGMKTVREMLEILQNGVGGSSKPCRAVIDFYTRIPVYNVTAKPTVVKFFRDDAAIRYSYYKFSKNISNPVKNRIKTALCRSALSDLAGRVMVRAMHLTEIERFRNKTLQDLANQRDRAIERYKSPGNALDIKQLQGVFNALGLGAGMSAAVLLAELIVAKLRSCFLPNLTGEAGIQPQPATVKGRGYPMSPERKQQVVFMALQFYADSVSGGRVLRRRKTLFGQRCDAEFLAELALVIKDMKGNAGQQEEAEKEIKKDK